MLNILRNLINFPAVIQTGLRLALRLQLLTDQYE